MRHPHDISISTWHWPAQPPLFSASHRPILCRSRNGHCPQARHSFPWSLVLHLVSLFRDTDLARRLRPRCQSPWARYRRRFARHRDDDLRLPRLRPCDAAFRGAWAERRRHCLLDRAYERDCVLRNGVRARDHEHAKARDSQAPDAARRDLHPRCRDRALVSHLPRASGTARAAAGAGHDRTRDGRLAAARRRHGTRLAHRGPSASGLYHRHARDADGEGAELADQRNGGMAFIRRRDSGAGAVMSSWRKPGWRERSYAPALHVIPPSTTSSIPVTYFASSEARNSAALATSKASPMWPIGTCASRPRHIASTSPLA